MIGIHMVRHLRGSRLWSVDSDRMDDAMKDVMRVLTESRARYCDTDPVIEVRFTLNKFVEVFYD